MRVALICPYAWDVPGGVQSHVRGLAASLRERGHGCVVLAPRSSRVPLSEDDVVSAGRTLPVPANGSVAPIAFGPAAWRGVRRALEDFEPTIVHAHEPLIPSTSLIATLVSRSPVVGTFHASRERSLGYRFARPVLERAHRRLAVRIAVSPQARRLVEGHFRGEIDIVPNGFDARRFVRVAPAEKRRKRIVFLGRIERRKGLEVLIRAAALVGECELVVVGAGPEEGRCRSVAAELGVEVRFSGRLDDAEVASLLASATVFCSPALGGESFGIVLLEAMAAGAPVVCSDLPGYRSAAGDAARYFRAGDVRHLADDLRTLLTNAPLREELRARGLERAALFDWKQIVPRIEKLYERAIAAG